MALLSHVVFINKIFDFSEDLSQLPYELSHFDLIRNWLWFVIQTTVMHLI